MTAPAFIANASAVDNTGTATSLVLPSLPTGSGGVLILTVCCGSAATLSISGEVALDESLNLANVDTWYKLPVSLGLSTTVGQTWLARGTPAVPTVNATVAGKLAGLIQRIGPVLDGAKPIAPAFHYQNSSTSRTLGGFWVPTDSVVVEHVISNNDNAGQTLDARMTQTARITSQAANNGARLVIAGLHAATANARAADYVGTVTTASVWGITGLVVLGTAAPPTWPVRPTQPPNFRPKLNRQFIWNGSRWVPSALTR